MEISCRLMQECLLFLFLDDFADEPTGKCKTVSILDKPKNRKVVQRHFEHKVQKLRERLRKKAEKDRKLAEEMKKLEEERRENFVFRLADKSFPASECDSNENAAMKGLPPAYEKFDYPVNESELSEFKRKLNEKSLEVIKSEKLLPTLEHNTNGDDMEIGIPCGGRSGDKVFLRSFHDRISSEPRGETNYHLLKGTGKSTCLTHKEWLDTMANDPEILVSTLKG